LQCFHIYKKFIDEIAKACFGYLNTQSSGKNYAATLAFGGSDSFGVRIFCPMLFMQKHSMLPLSGTENLQLDNAPFQDFQRLRNDSFGTIVRP
jgi:hypothetical protein